SAFKLLSRSRTGEATQLARRIFEPAKEMLAPEARGRQAFRLIGVGVSGLVQAGEADRGNLLDHELKRDIATESAVDAIRARFGNAAVIRGTAIGAGKRRGKD
ncbi:MAG: DNA polymerase IV, partial [Methylocystis sp.]|nr:DNA polymerase IV [Methylocystis sp.]